MSEGVVWDGGEGEYCEESGCGINSLTTHNSLSLNHSLTSPPTFHRIKTPTNQGAISMQNIFLSIAFLPDP